MLKAATIALALIASAFATPASAQAFDPRDELTYYMLKYSLPGGPIRVAMTRLNGNPYSMRMLIMPIEGAWFFDSYDFNVDCNRRSIVNYSHGRYTEKMEMYNSDEFISSAEQTQIMVALGCRSWDRAMTANPVPGMRLAVLALFTPGIW